MCRNGQQPEPSLLWDMARQLGHRGPDDSGIHCQGAAGLAQTRLSIIGLATGHQPMSADNGQLALAANGEVYNYIELNQEFRRLQRMPATDSDCESILHAYAVYGDDFLTHLRGMYAFALYDHARQRLLLVRDRLGIKPLFYLRLADRIAFASEIKALLPLLPARPELCASALRQFLLQQFSSGEQTIVNGIRRVLPGEMLAIDARLQIRRHRYWSPLEIAPQRLGADQALEQLDGLLADCMREHMRSDVPFGLFLSGGLDSALLACQLHARGAGRIHSFSVGYSATSMPDELDAARRVADWFGFQHHALQLSPARVAARIPHSVWAADELMRDYASMPTSILAETAARDLKVVFTGEGGDEVFAGYGRYRTTRLQRWAKSLLFPGSGGLRSRPQWSRHWMRQLLGPALVDAREQARQPFVDNWQSTPPTWSDLQRRQYMDLSTALPDNLLVKTDRMQMAFGLEGRVPFLDHRLVEFGLSLPDHLKVRGRTGKWLPRQWAAPYLPPGHLDHRKRGFHVPIGDWMTGEVATHIGQALLHSRGVAQWFKSDAIEALVGAYRAGRGGGRELFCLMQFAIWHRIFIEQPGQRPQIDDNPLDWIASDA
ncbi:MAG: hypothetical protein N838_24765 [Thiohalocapsa sp. PB-PSB1]|nr:MAG: hypothetical protein N838_24765 [Thiohalocapsa sp. PB-PSB1]